jgi:glucosamine--fructose-6-phosphate aminotransferase (isomerizing)
MKQYIHSKSTRIVNTFGRLSRLAWEALTGILTADVYFGRSPAGLVAGSIVFFPYHASMLCCGIAGIVSYKAKKPKTAPRKIAQLNEMAAAIGQQGCEICKKSGYNDIEDKFLGGEALIDSLWQAAQSFKSENPFFSIYTKADEQKQPPQ